MAYDVSSLPLIIWSVCFKYPSYSLSGVYDLVRVKPLMYQDLNIITFHCKTMMILYKTASFTPHFHYNIPIEPNDTEFPYCDQLSLNNIHFK